MRAKFIYEIQNFERPSSEEEFRDKLIPKIIVSIELFDVSIITDSKLIAPVGKKERYLINLFKKYNIKYKFIKSKNYSSEFELTGTKQHLILVLWKIYNGERILTDEYFQVIMKHWNDPNDKEIFIVDKVL